MPVTAVAGIFLQGLTNSPSTAYTRSTPLAPHADFTSKPQNAIRKESAMPSERQRNANRRNAAKGGPKTDEGRAAVRFNAVKHGCTAVTLVLPGEDVEAVKQLREDLFQEYQPATPTEHLLLEEFVRCSWRLLRMRRVEAQMWTGHIIGLRLRKNLGRDVNQDDADRAIAATLAETPASEMVNYFRYERMSTRDFYRALEKLEATQRARHRAESLPAAQTASKPVSPVSPASAQTDAPLPAHCLHNTEVSDCGIGTVSPPHTDAPRLTEESLPDAA
jgi:hypothetical protein